MACYVTFFLPLAEHSTEPVDRCIFKRVDAVIGGAIGPTCFFCVRAQRFEIPHWLHRKKNESTSTKHKNTTETDYIEGSLKNKTILVRILDLRNQLAVKIQVFSRRPCRPCYSWIQQIGDGTPFSIRAEWSRASRRGHSRLTQRTSAVYAIRWWWRWWYRQAVKCADSLARQTMSKSDVRKQYFRRDNFARKSTAKDRQTDRYIKT